MKIIESKQDLAINGAPPAFKQPLHVGCLNIWSHEAIMRLAGAMFDYRRLSKGS